MTDKTVLFVDDNEALQKMMKYLFMVKGIKMESALSGQDGLDFLDTEKPDLIITDIMMTGMNGFEFCNQVKSKNHLKKIPIIALTASPQLKHEERMFSVGASDFLAKPFEAKVLLNKVLKAMDC